ncbi:hypothetical protein EW146_g8443 [Bondarzewia mesenterica]|uniref:N-acetyltransferase domain-containing protein n=1 Tax=Bondarzewia mesenterica TaxID=1095465 RepID=A0A4S4LEC6_9AGAM|nr:hypothetical protein EW146_g8443 [Bondarzewia mesenterica]
MPGLHHPQLRPFEIHEQTGQPYLRLPAPHTHIILTPTRLADIPFVVEILNDPRVYKWLYTPPWPYLPEHANGWIGATKSEADAVWKELVDTSVEDPDAPPKIVGACPVRAIREQKEDGTEIFLGDCGFNLYKFEEILDESARAQSVEENSAREIGDPKIIWQIGDYLKPSHHGQGIMSAVIATLMREWMVPRMGVRQVRPSIHDGNRGSMRVFEKNGFVLYKTMKDVIFTSPLEVTDHSTMGIIRPATPGFLVTLLATILLAVVSFSVPWFKSVYFLKASLSVENINGSITFGVLGYCMQLPNGTTCSKASVGYQLDINALVGNNTSINIPQVAVKWITYALVLHIVALILAAGSALFGLLAHVRELSMTCFSTCISGFGAAIALLAFIFDLAFFFIAKSRINSVKGGSASMGNAIWLTLAAWLLLFFAGCFYGFGRCCIKRRPRDPYNTRQNNDRWNPPGISGNGYDEQMRLDAVKAEADRKARQKQGEQGLPAFQEYDPTQPLTHGGEEEEHPSLHYRDAVPGAPGQQTNIPGYARGAEGTRAVDEYYAPTNQQANAYPPQPRRQATGGSAHTQTPSGYVPSQFAYAHGNAITSSPPPVPVPSDSNFMAAGGQYNHSQYPTQNTQYGNDQYGNNQYASNIGASTYNNAGASHQQYATANSYSDPYNPYTQPQEPVLNPDTYNNTGILYAPSSSVHPEPNSYYQPPPHQSPPPARSYTLGGGGYGSSSVPDLGGNSPAAYVPYAGTSHSPAPINTNVAPVAAGATSPRGPRAMVQSPVEQYEDSPPLYDAATAQPPGQWSSKH